VETMARLRYELILFHDYIVDYETSGNWGIEPIKSMEGAS